MFPEVSKLKSRNCQVAVFGLEKFRRARFSAIVFCVCVCVIIRPARICVVKACSGTCWGVGGRRKTDGGEGGMEKWGGGGGSVCYCLHQFEEREVASKFYNLFSLEVYGGSNSHFARLFVSSNLPMGFRWYPQ